MSITRLLICVIGVYSTFLLWAIAQERLSSPFTSTIPPHLASRLPSPLALNAAQSLSSCLCAAGYLFANRPRGRTWTWAQLLGWDLVVPAWFGRSGSGSGGEVADRGMKNGGVKREVVTNGTATIPSSSSPSPSPPPPPPPPPPPGAAGTTTKPLLLLLLQVSALQTLASPIGFASLRYISYPMMVLAKSCKLIPVLLLNVLIYRRRFKPYKYLVVALVSAGIAVFMYAGAGAGGGGKRSTAATSATAGGQMVGLGLLGVNLIIDGLTNATQDQLFLLHPQFAGQQLMFNMSLLSLFITLPILLVPPTTLHHLPAPLTTLFPSHAHSHTHSGTTSLTAPLFQTSTYLLTHPTALPPLIAYAALGGLGQLFIFETIAHFGSLSLVMLTVTRKLVTMLLSVAVFGHQLRPGQWVGVAVVFAGIGVEAGMKRREILSKRIMEERQKSKLKNL